MKKQFFFLIIIIAVFSFLFFYQNSKNLNKIEKDAKQEGNKISDTPKTSNQEFALENLIDLINEDFKSQAKTIGGESTIKIDNTLSYVHGDAVSKDIEGLCVIYSKPTSSLSPLAVYPEFNFPKEFLMNANYRGIDQKDFSVFDKEHKISCNIEHTKNTKKICCIYYSQGDPIAK
ncbi:hypothetical protein KBC01_01375 [Candidatus Parcubacteria bacterium]|nr:hypothetical protein [Candidatus Parcubacteria bacterium]